MNAELYKDQGYKLMGAAFEVYNEIGYGLSEDVYQESFEIELALRSIPFVSKQELACRYKGRELKVRYIPDLFVFGGIVVELKAATQILPQFEAQLFNYMRISKSPVGYLINFGNKEKLEWKRLILSELVSAEPDPKPTL